MREVNMTQEKVNGCMMMFQQHIPEEKTLLLRKYLEDADERCYEHLISMPLKSSVMTLLLSIFLGGIGADRFYIGDTGLGVAKLLVGWLTFGIWPLIDIFFSFRKAKEKNLTKILDCIFASGIQPKNI